MNEKTQFHDLHKDSFLILIDKNSNEHDGSC